MRVPPALWSERAPVPLPGEHFDVHPPVGFFEQRGGFVACFGFLFPIQCGFRARESTSARSFANSVARFSADGLEWAGGVEKSRHQNQNTSWMSEERLKRGIPHRSGSLCEGVQFPSRPGRLDPERLSRASSCRWWSSLWSTFSAYGTDKVHLFEESIRRNRGGRSLSAAGLPVMRVKSGPSSS